LRRLCRHPHLHELLLDLQLVGADEEAETPASDAVQEPELQEVHPEESEQELRRQAGVDVALDPAPALERTAPEPGRKSRRAVGAFASSAFLIERGGRLEGVSKVAWFTIALTLVTPPLFFWLERAIGRRKPTALVTAPAVPTG
jgi:hypothetical protein